MLSPTSRNRKSRPIRLWLVWACAIACLGCNAQPRFTDLDISNTVGPGWASAANQAGVWNGWRGGSRGAVADDRTLPVAWDASRGIRWAAEVPGQGNSSPIVVGDAVLITSGIASPRGTELHVHCLDRRDGSPRWSTMAAVASGPTHQKNGHASATVASDGERLFASFGTAGLYCLNLWGERLWHAELGPVEHQWGSASSPVVFGSLVIQLSDSQSQSHLSAFDTRTGRLVWQTLRDSRGCWSTPLLAPRPSNGRNPWQLIVNGTGSESGEPGYVVSYDPLTGRELWRARGTSDITCPTPIVAGETVVSTSNNAVFAVRHDGRGDISQSHIRWRLTSGGPYVPTGLFYRDRLYLITDGGVATCHDPQTGETLWRKRFRGTFSASLVAGDGKVFAVSEQGDVQVFSAADQFESLATNRMDGRCLATPALSDGQLFLRTETHMYCIAPPSEAEVALTVPALSLDAVSLDDGAAASPSDHTDNDARGTSQDSNL